MNLENWNEPANDVENDVNKRNVKTIWMNWKMIEQYTNWMRLIKINWFQMNGINYPKCVQHQLLAPHMKKKRRKKDEKKQKRTKI